MSDVKSILPADVKLELEGKHYIYKFPIPSPAQKRAVVELMDKHKVSYEKYRALQLELINSEFELHNLSKDSQKFFQKIQEVEFKTTFRNELFAIWALKPGQGYSQKTDEEKDNLEKWFDDYGCDGVRIADFFVATQ